jgi:hypothetical protein
MLLVKNMLLGKRAICGVQCLKGLKETTTSLAWYNITTKSLENTMQIYRRRHSQRMSVEEGYFVLRKYTRALFKEGQNYVSRGVW